MPSSSAGASATADPRDALHLARQRLEHAYERDLATTLVRYGEPKLLGRQSIPFNSFLSYVYQQQCFNRTSGHASGTTAAAGDEEVEGHTTEASSGRHHVNNTLPDLIWRSLETVMAAAEKGKKKKLAAAAGGCNADEEEEDSEAEAAGAGTVGRRSAGSVKKGSAFSRNNANGKDTAAHTASPPAAAVDGSVDSADVVESRAKVLHYLFPKAQEEAMATLSGATGGPSSTGAGSGSKEKKRKGSYVPPGVADHDVFYGVRQIPVSSPAYLTTIRDWAMALGSAEAIPDAVRSLLAAGHLRKDAAAPSAPASGAKGGDAIGEAGSILDSYEYNPIVKTTPSAVLNALIPPRVLLYYDVDPLRTVAHFRKRLQRMENIARMELENARHAGNKPLMLALEAERAALRDEDPPVGDVMLLVEEASPLQSTRHDLVQLEHDVDHCLKLTGARCWGLPIQTNPQSSAYRDEANTQRHSVAGNSGRALSKKGAKGTGSAAPVRVVPPAAETVNADGTSAAAANFYRSLKEGVKPHALNREDGGTATVMPTLNLLELSRPRTVIQYEMLGKEILRQVALDLPERGVLLSRLFNGTDLAMRCYDELVREATQSALQHRSLDGLEEVHATSRSRIAVLEDELTALRATKATLQSRKKALQEWVEERVAADEAAQQRSESFQEVICERLKRHADEVRAAQDKERRGSNAE